MTKLKVIRQGYREFDETTWLNWMMVQVPEDWTDAHVKEIIDWYPMYGGPGQYFRSRGSYPQGR
jgi:hypothetical protein